jgi:hypothetical protein
LGPRCCFSTLLEKYIGTSAKKKKETEKRKIKVIGVRGLGPGLSVKAAEMCQFLPSELGF